MKRSAIVGFAAALVALLFGFSACQKEFSVQTGASLTAQGSLYDATGNCMSDSVVGTYYNGITPSQDTNYVLVKVNVTVAGTYNITSDVQNGVYFADSGYFTTTGIDTVKLFPVGTPIIPGTNQYTISFDSTTCYFNVTTNDSTGHSTGGTTNPNQSDTAWKFTGPVGSYNGIVDTAYTKDSLGSLYLYVIGSTSTGDSVFEASVVFSGGAIVPGTYNTSSSALFAFINNVSGSNIYLASPNTSGVSTTITITSYNATTKIVSGTLSGTAQNAASAPVNITLGSFTAQTQ
jgi:hypothetical protein